MWLPGPDNSTLPLLILPIECSVMLSILLPLLMHPPLRPTPAPAASAAWLLKSAMLPPMPLPLLSMPPSRLMLPLLVLRWGVLYCYTAANNAVHDWGTQKLLPLPLILCTPLRNVAVLCE